MTIFCEILCIYVSTVIDTNFSEIRVNSRCGLDMVAYLEGATNEHEIFDGRTELNPIQS